jgi:uncharacterized protein (TIGR02677 family)
MLDGIGATEAPPAEPAVGHFPLQARRDLRAAFSYLQAPQRADYYQAIVRVFLKNVRQYYRIYLTVEQIAGEIGQLYADYSADKCRTDLEQLESWHNVVRTFDTAQRHTTIDSFLHPTVLYRATPETLEIEEMYLRLEQQTETTGELRRGDLDHLIQLFGEVDELVKEVLAADGGPRTDDAREREQRLAETWRRLAEQARTILDNTSKYIHTLAVVRQEAASTEIEGYLRYKQHVVAYVQSFAISLERVSSQLQRTFRSWEESGARDRILRALADHGVILSLQLPSLDERLADAASQLSAVADWFSGPDWAEYFGRAARFEVNAVLQRAQLLATTAHLGASYLVDLESLAQRLLRLEDAEAAGQLLQVAFAHQIPRALPERLAGTNLDPASPWEGHPAISLTFQPIQRASGSGGPPTPLIRDRADLAALREAELAERRDRHARLARLFGVGEREITAMPIADDADVRIIVEVARRCVEDVDRRWRADDGSLIALLDPAERRAAILRGDRGCYILPRFRFRRLAPTGPSPRARERTAVG